jgi:Methyltransferase domain
MLRMITTLLKKTDRRRWADPNSLYASWEPRNRRVAALVPNNSRVIEFGAGKRILERYLDPSCTYVPSDVVDRGPGTIVCDLNQRPLPDLGSDVYDVAVLSGVLEYVRDVPSMLDWLTKYIAVCVLTYAPAKANGYSPRALLDGVSRLRHGWMNNYREEELRSLFRERSFELVQDDDWEEQRLFVFSQHPLHYMGQNGPVQAPIN